VRIVSGNDHGHAYNSTHYQDRAIDFWSGDMDGLNEWLVGLQYRTLWQVRGHFNHVHAER
jgi:hypothetical protein